MQKHIQQGPHRERPFSFGPFDLGMIREGGKKGSRRKTEPFALTQRYNGQLPMWLTSLP